MAAYNFQARFAEAVASGQKRQTIRAIGKRRHARVGERVQLYTGMRTKKFRKLVDPDPVCTSVERVRLQRTDGMRAAGGCIKQENGEYLSAVVGEHGYSVSALAQADGFESPSDMFDWFERVHGLPFEGLLIRWRAEGVK